MLDRITKVLKSIDNYFDGTPKQPQDTTERPKPKAQTQTWPSSNGMTGGAKWPHGLGNSGASTTINPAETIQNVRKLSHQSTQARGLMKRATDLTIDEGLKLGPSPNWRILGITDDEFKEEWHKDKDGVELIYHFLPVKKVKELLVKRKSGVPRPATTRPCSSRGGG